MLVFPGTEEHFGEAYDAMKAGGLTVKQLIWDKGYCGGSVGARLNYSTENMLIGFSTPEVSPNH
jgi:hypothetical protein